jgi:FAD:protein FMN transferase
MTYFRKLMLSAWFLASSAGASMAQHLHTYSHPAMGSVFYITLYADDGALAEKAANAAFARVDALNQIASDYLPESELSHLNSAPTNEPFHASPDLFAMIKRSIEVARVTDGAFDITAAYAVQLWRRAKRQHEMPTPERIAHAIAMTDWRALKLDESARTVTKTKPDLKIDLGGIGKGYAANEALLVLKQHGITRAMVAGSGDLAIGDPPPGKPGWDVALRTFEKPEETDDLTHLMLHNCGCSTSGDLHQFVELNGQRYSHIIDPKTGLGLTQRIACTVLAPTAADSDAFDTAMCILGQKRGLEIIETLPGYSARFVVLTDGHATTAKSLHFGK